MLTIYHFNNERLNNNDFFFKFGLESGFFLKGLP